MSCPYDWQCKNCEYLWPYNPKHSYDACQLGFRLQKITCYYAEGKYVEKEIDYTTNVTGRIESS